jgi:ferric-dicitrate binding protein FerR (iron transport regulator)
MDLTNLDSRAQSSLFELCARFKIEADDPIVGVLLAIKGIEKGIIAKWEEERGELLDLEKKVTGLIPDLNSQITLQKEVAESIHAQAKFFSEIRRGILFGFFLIFTIGAGMGWVLNFYIQGKSNALNRISEQGGNVKVIETPGQTTLTIQSQSLASVTRNGTEVSLRFSKGK